MSPLPRIDGRDSRPKRGLCEGVSSVTKLRWTELNGVVQGDLLLVEHAEVEPAKRPRR